ncbi:MAG: hypothetical protein HGB10_02235 [Coriobacteriia bacterium]|nr:hypothetical protein [Coriobacteriia bacterium]
METIRTFRSTAAVVVVACALIGASGCSIMPWRDAPAAETRSGAVRPAPVAAVASANRYDIAQAKDAMLAYLDALASRDASEAAKLMTPYRRGETASKGWKSDVGWWKTARVRTVMHPGRYVSDERTFAELYAEQIGKPPYKLVVLNVAYTAVLGRPAGDLDFVLTQASPKAPWLVHDFGGALQPNPEATPTVDATESGDEAGSEHATRSADPERRP